jgi:hypothetical protein
MANTSSRGIQHPRLHGYSFRIDSSIRLCPNGRQRCTKLLIQHECQKIRANPTVTISPIGSAVAVNAWPQRAATHLARYRDCARFTRRYDRLHDEPSSPAAWDARCGRIESPKHRTTAMGESVHDAETGSKVREPRDYRRTSQRAAVARGFTPKGTGFVEGSHLPNKVHRVPAAFQLGKLRPNDLWTPHVSASARRLVRLSLQHRIRPQHHFERVLRMRRARLCAHELGCSPTQLQPRGTVAARIAPQVCFGNAPQPPKGCTPTSARCVRLRTWQGTRVPCALHAYCTSTPTKRTHHVDLDEARASDLHMCTCVPRDAREETTG